ncbi:MAG: DUF1178 family protein [Geminicoccales bacterium]
MILFDLRCSQGHDFEAWFRDSKSYDQLHQAGEITCAICGDDKVEKALMAPNVRTSKAIAPPSPMDISAKDGPPAVSAAASKTSSESADSPTGPSVPAAAPTTMEPAKDNSAFPEKVVEAMKMLREVQTFVEKNFEPVGNKFAEEARKIHYGESEKRNIYGEATSEETETLADEGIEVNQMPWLPPRNS